MKPESIIIIGTGRLPCRCLESCLARLLPVACVESGGHVFSPLAAQCRKHRVECTLMSDPQSLARFFLSIKRPTLVVSAYNYFIFPQEVLDNPALNIINFHNSLLPRHRGRNAPTWSIYEMDAITGITWHQVRLPVDTGEVIVQKQITIAEGITAWELTLQTLDVAAEAFEEILPSLLDRSYECRPVENNGTGSFHRSTDVPNGGWFDLGWDIKQAHAFLRALDYGKFKVFAEPKVHFLGADRSIAAYQIQENHPGVTEAPSITFHKKGLVMRNRETELLITCERLPD